MANNRQHAMLLACFDGFKDAASARRPLETQMQSNGDHVLDTVVLQTNAKHGASVYDPRRVIAGTLTAAVTWGLFGLLTGTAGIQSLVIWAVIGAACGGLFAYFSEHILSKEQLTRLGKQLPARSSALLTFAETSNSRNLLETATAYAPSVASVAIIGDDLSAQILTRPADLVERPSISVDLGARPVPAPETAKQIATRIAGERPKVANAPQVELVINADPSGSIHVSDPMHGVEAWSKSNLTSWGGFGLVLGAIAGATGGGGLFGFLKGGLLTGIFWGLFGFVAGVLYGRWTGTAVTGRRLKSIGPLLPPGASMLVAWAEGPISQEALDTLASSESQRLVLRFNRVERGTVLEATSDWPLNYVPKTDGG